MILRLGAAVLILVAATTIVVGDSAAIRGVVHDEGGKPLAGAMVLVLPHQGREFETSADGSFLVPDLRPGRYTVIVLGPPLLGGAYTPRVKHDLEVSPSQTASLRIQLEPATRPVVVYYDSPTKEELAAYSSVLAEMEEPGMCASATLADGAESYRFLWLRSFHNLVLVHLVLERIGTASLQYKELAQRNGSEDRQLTEDRRVDVNRLLLETLAEEEFVGAVLDQFRQRAEKHFWDLPYRVDDDTIGVDGATWIIEGTKDGRCHVVSRWSPTENDGFRQLAEELMRFSGSRLYYDEVY